MLVIIADKLGRLGRPTASIKNLRLVDKRFYSAVGQSAVSLRPHKDLTVVQLQKLSQMFGNTAFLDLSRCQILNNESLRGMHSLFPRLRRLELNECPWLTAAGLAHLGSFTQLQCVSISSSTS